MPSRSSTIRSRSSTTRSILPTRPAKARPLASGSSSGFLPANKLTLKSAIDVNLSNETVRLPIYPGDAPVPDHPGQTERVWYILEDASDQGLAEDLGRQLRAEAGQHRDRRPGCRADGDRGQPFASGQSVRAGGDPFPGRPGLQPDADRGPWTDRLSAEELQPRAVATNGYSPFIRIAGSDVVYNAPIIAAGNGRSSSFDVVHHTNTEDRVLERPHRRTVGSRPVRRVLCRPAVRQGVRLRPADRLPQHRRRPAADGGARALDVRARAQRRVLQRRRRLPRLRPGAPVRLHQRPDRRQQPAGTRVPAPRARRSCRR